MNRFLVDGTLTEASAGQDFVYVINDPTCVAADEYNQISKGDNESFVNVMYGNFNGQNAFYYVVNTYKSVSELAEGLNVPRFIEIIKDFLGIVIKTKESGTLKEENIITSLSKIYIDPKTKKVKAVYAPVIQKVPVKAVLFENEVRDVFARLMKKLQNLQGERADEVVSWLIDEKLSITELYDKLSEEDSKSRVTIANIRDTGELTTMKSQPVTADIPGHTGYLAARNMPAITLTHLNGKLPEIVVTNDNFVIGRSADTCDGVVPDTSASRVHCKISQVGNKVAVIDLGSANGTFVNGSGLKSGEARYISDNDTVRIGKCDFLIKFPKEVILGDAAAKAQVREAVDKMSATGIIRSMAAAAPIAETPADTARTADAPIPNVSAMTSSESEAKKNEPVHVVGTQAGDASVQKVSGMTVQQAGGMTTQQAEGSTLAPQSVDEKMISSENPARLLMVYSAAGGAGKTTIALGLSRILAESGHRVFYICTSPYQTFGRLLGFEDQIEDDRIVEAGEFRKVRQYIKRENFEFLQEIKRTSISAYAGITSRTYIDIIREATVSDRYDIVIVDADSTIDDLNKWLIERSDQLLIVTKQDERSFRATKLFADLVSVIAANKSTYVCNDYQETENDATADSGVFGGLEIAERIEHFRNYDKLVAADLAEADSLRKLAARIVVKHIL